MTCVVRCFLLALLLLAGTPAGAEPAPWMDKSLSSEARARLVVAAMTIDEKIGLLHTCFGVAMRGLPKPNGSLNSAGFNPGVPRLGIPPIQETDAGLGIANPTGQPFQAVALPSGLSLGATFDPKLAVRAGAMIGAEARAMGFNVLLGGGVNITRDPRGGRNFEYVGEDPLLTGTMAGSSVAGAQSQGIVSTLKHFVINAQENGRVLLSSEIGESAARESDLLAFEIAIEGGQPGAVMTAYNRINGTYASENTHLIDDVLKGDWGFAGWVMSDWSATHSTEAAALAGLDQESGIDNDPVLYFGEPLKAAVEAGRVPAARLDDMVQRILRSMFAAGAIDRAPAAGGPIDYDADAAVAKTVEEQGIVLLKNQGGVLPLGPTIRRLLVVGAHADQGVLSGGGSSQVLPRGFIRFEGDPPGNFWGKPKLFHPSSPVAALKRQAPDVAITYLDGDDVAQATRAARDADAVIVFGEQWSAEARDQPGLSLPKNQDALIGALAAANRRTIVVLETGGPVTMPWLDAASAVLEAWYPGHRGGEAIADVLLGRVNPSGHLPITFPAHVEQLPRPQTTDLTTTTSEPGMALKGGLFAVDYNIEGADVGYKWFLRTGKAPLFPFGYGLSYTHFKVARLTANARGGPLVAAFDVGNTGDRAGIATPQVYLEGGDLTRRLVGFTRVALRPGETRRVTLTVDPRLLAHFDAGLDAWRIAGGRYTLSVRPDAIGSGPRAVVSVGRRQWGARHGPCGAEALCVGSR